MDNSKKTPLRLKILLGLLALTVMGAATYTTLPGPVVADTIADALSLDRRSFTSGGRGYVLVERFATNRTSWASPRKLFFESGSTLPTNGVYSNIVFASTGGRLVFRDAFSANEFLPEWWGGEQSTTLIGYTNRLTWQAIAVDSRAATQAAIDWAEFRGGGRVNFGPGDWRFGDSSNPGTVFMKPRVSLIGSWIPMSDDSYEGTYSATNVTRISHSTMLHFSGGSTNGYGAPCISFLGSAYYTNQYYQAFTDALGDWVAYYRGGNVIANLGIWSGWQWSWNSSNAPAAAIYINEVAGTTIQDVFVGPTAGPGIYIRGGFGTRIFDSYIVNNLAGGVVVVDTSDIWVDRTSIPVANGSAISFTGETRTNGTYASTANTHKLINLSTWNGKEELVGWVGTSTSYDNGGTTENVAVRRTGWSADASTDQIGISSRIGSDTGLPVMVKGSNLPGGLNTNSIYYVRWGTQGGTNFSLCLTSGRAMNGGSVVDITSAGGSGTWWLEAPSSVIYASDAQEIQVQNVRADQSWSTLVALRRVPRFMISGFSGFELGLNQTEVRQSRKTTFEDPNIVEISLEDCSDGLIVGNLFSGSKGNSSLSTPWIHNAIGIKAVRTYDTVISGNVFTRLNTGILIDSESANIATAGNVFGSWVSRQIDSGSTYGIAHNVPYFDGKTNSQIVASIPAASTNITGDFAVAIKARVPSMTTNGFANGRHSALFNLTSVTNTTGYGALVPRSFLLSFWRSSIDNTMNIVGTFGGTNYDQSNPSTERFSFGAGVNPFMGKDVEIVVQRATNYVQVFVEGIRVVNSAITGSTTGTVFAPYLLMGQVGDSGQFSHCQSPIYGIALSVGKSFTTEEVNAGVPWGRKGGTGATICYDFVGASLNGGVMDISGNGANGTVQQIGAVAPEFGSADDLSLTGSGVTRTGKKSWTITGGGGGGSLSDGNYGDVTVSGSGTAIAINGDSVALGTDTTGNYVAGLSGTGGRVSVSGSGSEGATPTVDLASSGVSAGSYTAANITVDAYGRITAAANGVGGSATNVAFNDLTDGFTNGWSTGYPAVWHDDGTVGPTNSLTVSNLTVSGAMNISSPIAASSITNAMATDAEVAAATDDDAIGFDDADGLWTATTIGPALEEMNNSINSGVPNGTGAKVHWSQVLGVPAGLADGTDDGSASLAYQSGPASGRASTFGDYIRSIYTNYPVSVPTEPRLLLLAPIGGQSLATGSGAGSNSFSTSPRHPGYSLSWTQGVHYGEPGTAGVVIASSALNSTRDLYADVVTGPLRSETPVVAAVDYWNSYWSNNLAGNRARVLAVGHGLGGAELNAIDEGTASFSNLIAHIQGAALISASSNWILNVPVWYFVHGENDTYLDTPVEAYRTNFLTMYERMNAVSKAASGQSNDPIVIMTQTASRTYENQSNSWPANAQLFLNLSDARIKVAVPTYVFPTIADGVHLTNFISAWLGEYLSKAARHELFGLGWNPVMPTNVVISGTNVVIKYHVPSPPLVFDTTLVSNPGSYGYGLDGATIGTPTVSGNTVTIPFTAGTPTRVKYGWNGTLGADDGPTTGQRGNLRDSDPEIGSISSSNLYNWGLIFNLPTTAPSTPSGLAAAAGNGKITLSWSRVSDASYYTLRRALGSGGPYTTIKVTNGTSFEDADVAPLVTYYYVVGAHGPSGDSSQSAEVVGTTSGGSSTTRSWIPTDLGSRLAGWWRASSLSVGEGNPIDSWTDESGNGYHLTASSTVRPTQQTSGGRPVVRFDGTDDRMDQASIGTKFSSIGEASFWTVGRPNTTNVTAGNRNLWYLSRVTNGSVRLSFSQSSITPGRWRFGGTRVDGDTTDNDDSGTLIDTNSTVILQTKFDFTNGDKFLNTNGVIDTTDTGFASAGSTASENLGLFRVGASALAAGGTATNWYNGDIEMQIVTTGVLTTEETQKIEGYIAHALSLTNLLAADHPYKTNAPTITIGSAGTGDVVGPSSAVDAELAILSGTTGKLIRSGGQFRVSQSNLVAHAAVTNYVADLNVAPIQLVVATNDVAFIHATNAAAGRGSTVLIQASGANRTILLPASIKRTRTSIVVTNGSVLPVNFYAFGDSDTNVIATVGTEGL